MEFKKEYENFSFGIGSEKAVGSGRVTDIVSKKETDSPEENRRQLIAEAATYSITAIVGIVAGIIKIKKIRKKKNKKKK